VASAAAPLVSLEGVTRCFVTRSGTDVTALQEVSLAIERDQFVTVVGPSGCGKTTLMKLVGGIMPPTRGTVRLNGEVLARPSRKVGMVFQRPVLLPWCSVLENVLFPLKMLGWPTAPRKDEARSLIELVGLGGFENALPSELSGGMQQRVSICRALIYEPELLLMDEPFGALDAMMREDLGFELLRIWNEKRKTVLFVTHSITEAVMLADRVIVMTARPGRVVVDVPITLPRPRTPDTEFTAEFKDFAKTVKSAVYAEARGS
jgi:NitT/TauT family transport system ATP-binding protein